MDERQLGMEALMQEITPAMRAQYKALQAELLRLNTAYYDEDAPLVDDRVYDELLRELEAMEVRYPSLQSKDSVSQRPGGTAGSTRLHEVPMRSLQDVFDEAGVLTFTSRLRQAYPGLAFLVQEKIDGLSLSLRYEKGQLVEAFSRGDGLHVGEDLTANAKRLQGLPLQIDDASELLLLRAEVYLSKEAFLRINAAQEAAGERPFANPRNCAAGSMRQLDPEVVEARGLSCFVFDLMKDSAARFRGDIDALAYLKSLGLPVIPTGRAVAEDEAVLAAIHSIGKSRSSLPYGIDGAVIKVDDYATREALGSTSKAPRWALAYKYPPESKESRLREIIIQVGRTGRMTPLARFDPVHIDGSMVQRASLHNATQIAGLDLRIGDMVQVLKSGDIIPAVVGVNKALRPEDAVPYEMPTACPACGEESVQLEGEADRFCKNLDCPAQRARKLGYFASKDAMDIQGLGPAAVDGLLDMGVLESLPDLYRLQAQRDRLIADGRLGRQKRVDALLEAIEASKAQPFWRFLAGLGIPQVGRRTAMKLAEHYKGLWALAAAEEEALAELPDLGEQIAQDIRAYFDKEAHRAILKELEALGLPFKVQELERQSGPLEGQRFVITGRFEGFGRKALERRIIEQGGDVLSAVSAKVDYLLMGEKPGSKAKKAESLGIPSLDLAAFELLLTEKKGRKTDV